MFKKSKFIVVGLLGASMALTGCSATQKELTPMEKLQEANKKLNDADSYGMDMKMEVTMDMKDQGTIEMTMDSTVKCLLKPSMAMQMDTDMNMTMGELQQEMKMQQFMVKEDEEYVMYSGTDGTWEKDTMSGMAELEEAIKGQTALLDVEESIPVKSVGDKTVNGIECVEIQAEFTQEYFEKAFEDSGVLDSLGMDDAALEQAMAAIGDMDSLTASYYISKESNEIVGFYFDMSSLMKALMIQTMGVTEDQVGEVVMTIDATITDVNAVGEIVVPEEAKAA